MNKKTLLFLGILLTLFLGTFFTWKLCCEEQTDEDRNSAIAENGNYNERRDATDVLIDNAIDLSDPAGDYALYSVQSFHFKPSDHRIQRPVSNEIKDGLDELKRYLWGDDSKTIEITGVYYENERNFSSYENLGIARAHAIQSYFITRGIPSTKMNLHSKKENRFVGKNDLLNGPLSLSITTVAPLGEEMEPPENLE